MRAELTNGQWAELNDPKTITNGERRPLMEAFDRNRDVFDELGRVVREKSNIPITEASIRVLVTEWSFPGPIPSQDATALDNMLNEDYDRLAHACADLMPKMIWAPDPKSATASQTL